MTQFHVGQKVVCVNASEMDEAPVGVRIVGDLDGLRKGAIYTVRSIYIDHVWGGACIRLHEIERRPLSFFNGQYFESGYDPSRFRPIIERKTDISIFRAMLNPQKTEVTA